MQATTATLAAIIVMQVANLFLCRDPMRPVFSPGFFANRLIFAGLAAELGLLLAIVHTPWGNRLFGCAPLDAGTWLTLLPFALAMLALEEGRKAWLRRRARKSVA